MSFQPFKARTTRKLILPLPYPANTDTNVPSRRINSLKKEFFMCLSRQTLLMIHCDGYQVYLTSRDYSKIFTKPEASTLFTHV